MSKRFIRISSGWIPVSVLFLCTAALVAGQASANLPESVKAAPQPVAAASIEVVFSQQMLEQLTSLAVVVDTILALPVDIHRGVENSNLSHDESEHATPIPVTQ